MPPESRKLLEDMRRAAGQIADFTAGLSLDDYQSDQQLRWSVERGFEIIGEALSQHGKIAAALAGRISEYRKIISFRNILIHGYSRINHATTWDIVQEDLPKLRRELDDLLA